MAPPSLVRLLATAAWLLLASASASVGAAASVAIRVAGSGGNASSPYMYGIMFEDISHSGDGGM